MKKNQRLLHFIKKTDAVLAKIEDAFSMLCMTGMVIAVLVGVALRFIFRMPNPYGEEISRYLLIAAVFIGISLAQRERAHLGIDNLVMVLPQKWAKRLRSFTDFLSAFIYVFLAYESYMFTALTDSFGQKSPSMTFVPMALIYSFMLIGFSLSALTTVMMIISEYVFNVPLMSAESEEIAEHEGE